MSDTESVDNDTVYKIKVVYKKSRNNSFSDDDNDIDDDDTYTDYIDPDSNFVRDYCDDYGEVNLYGLRKLSDDKNDDMYTSCSDYYDAVKATLIIDNNIKQNFLKEYPPPPPPIRINICSNVPVLSYEERLKWNRKQIRCRFGDNCKYNKNGNCRYKHIVKN